MEIDSRRVSIHLFNIDMSILNFLPTSLLEIYLQRSRNLSCQIKHVRSRDPLAAQEGNYGQPSSFDEHAANCLLHCVSVTCRSNARYGGEATRLNEGSQNKSKAFPKARRPFRALLSLRVPRWYVVRSPSYLRCSILSQLRQRRNMTRMIDYHSVLFMKCKNPTPALFKISSSLLILQSL
jgi:hypothetical protein